MVWRGSTDIKDRIFAAIVYLIPLYYGVSSFGGFLLQEFPALQIIQIPLIPVAMIYRSLPFADLLIFIILFAAVVRNERICHFVRFNTMQAILIDILLFLVGMLLQILGGALGGFILETLSNVAFLGTLAACIYSMTQSALGSYPEIPGISQAVYNQVP